MENESTKNPIYKGLLSLGIEVVIILILTSIVIIVLNYFNLINVQALLNIPVGPAVKSKNINEVPKPGAGLSASQSASTRKLGPAIPNLQVIIKNKAIHNEFQTFEFEGKVASVTATKGYDQNLKVPFASKLVVSVGTGSDKVALVYPSQATDKIKVTDAQKKNIAFKDLKIGDKIIVKTVLSIYLQYPNNYYNVEITKQ